MRRATALISIPAAALIVACQAPDDTTPPGPPPLVAACAGDLPTGPQTIAGFDLARFMADTRLPSGVRVAAGELAFSPGLPGMVDLSLDLCLPGTPTLDDLLSVATGLAQDLKADELGTRTAALSISCVCPHLPGRTAVRDQDFQLHPWDGTPSAEAERMNWETSGG
ncbi:hypothetical protein ACWF82_17045 [Nocardia sp. NPDC055053]